MHANVRRYRLARVHECVCVLLCMCMYTYSRILLCMHAWDAGVYKHNPIN